MQLSQTIALTHHEHWDGGGYPPALQGEEIPLAGRICAICDVFDALLSARPYKGPWPLEARSPSWSGSQAPSSIPALVRAFLPLARDLHREWFVSREAPGAAAEPALTAG